MYRIKDSKMKKCIFFLFSVIMTVAMCRCSEDDDKVIFEGELNIDADMEDGCVISDSVVTLKASYKGSVTGTGDGEPNCTYKFYVGVDPDDLKEYKTNTPRLEPYKRYYWYAVYEAFGVVGKKTEMRTFYYVPSVVATTENGDGEWSTTLKWNEIGENMLPTTIKVTPNIEGYPFENNIEIKPGQNSYKFKLGDAGSPTNAAYTHWWDDSKAIYCEPIVYTYNFTISVKVDDRTFDFPQEVKDIIINKQDVVKDHEFNVYRLAKIGNKIWTIDDYRASTYYEYDVNNKLYRTKEAYLEINVKTGAVCYRWPAAYFNKEYTSYSEYKNYSIPEGFHISTDQDWKELEELYGVANDQCNEMSGSLPDWGKIGTSEFYQFLSYLYTGNDKHIKAKLSSPYGWETLARNDSVEQSVGAGAIFNAKPSHSYYDISKSGIEYKFTWTSYYVSDGFHRSLTSESNGIARVKDYSDYFSIRLVKD